MGIIDNDLFTQTNPNPNSPRNNPSLAGQLTNLNNEVNSIEETLVEGYVRESASVSYVSSSSFTVSGDVTAIYTNGRIVRFSDGTTGIVSSSSYSSTTAKTTVTMLTGTVPSSLSYVDIAIQAKGQTSGLASRVLGDNNVVVVSQKDNTGAAINILKLNSSNDLEIGGAGISSYKLNNSIIKPSSDSTSAIRITKADGTGFVLNVDTTNISIGIGTFSSEYALAVRKTDQLGTNAGSVLNISYFDSGSLNNNVSLRIQKYRTANGNNWQTEAIRIMRVTDVTEQAYISFFGNNIGIGIINPSYLLQLGADSAAKPSTNTWIVASDIRIKKDIKDFKDGLEIIKKLRPRTYKYNGLGGKGYDDKETHIGFIAQEIEEITPYMVKTGEGEIGGKKVNDFKSYEGHALPFILVNAVKELAKRVENLEKKYGEINKPRI